jgi:superfamily II DNA/RNA helicase
VKAVIFTESRRTQEYLFRILEETEFAGRVMLFNGANTDPKSKEIYRQWLDRHAGTDRISGSPSADMRAALVDYFREEAAIMIATEAAAEGINLQFCNLVVNYDLPWNPQRIEQRIGRCHRYGQKFDVVVVNFLNKKSAADQRVYALLDEKFRLLTACLAPVMRCWGQWNLALILRNVSLPSIRSVAAKNRFSLSSTNCSTSLNLRLSKARGMPARSSSTTLTRK